MDTTSANRVASRAATCLWRRLTWSKRTVTNGVVSPFEVNSGDRIAQAFTFAIFMYSAVSPFPCLSFHLPNFEAVLVRPCNVNKITVILTGIFILIEHAQRVCEDANDDMLLSYLYVSENNALFL